MCHYQHSNQKLKYNLLLPALDHIYMPFDLSFDYNNSTIKTTPYTLAYNSRVLWINMSVYSAKYIKFPKFHPTITPSHAITYKKIKIILK